ncbi:MAG: NAD(+) synthase [Bacillota bacterium]|nr:NAD(+) synthase [Bacillota bacterium]
MPDLLGYGYIRAAVAVPQVSVGNTEKNKTEILRLIGEAASRQAHIVLFPELSLTGYTCADLFHQTVLLCAAERALSFILMKTSEIPILAAIGLPVQADNQLFNCCALIYKGRILGVVPKTYIPNYNEFYEKRWFASSSTRTSDSVTLCGQNAPFGENIIFEDLNSPLRIGAELCEDLWVPIPPSSLHALNGANLLLNLSASNELVGKYEYRRELVKQQSARCYAGYLYASSGEGESTTDVVFGGHAIIAENGAVISELRFPEGSGLGITDIDIEKLQNDRRKFNSFMACPESKPYRTVAFSTERRECGELLRSVDPRPFVPGIKAERELRCREILTLQHKGLAQRMKKTDIKKAVVGISGGLDSTLALLVAVQAVKSLGLPAENVIGITMPGFGTTGRTYRNSLTLMGELGVAAREIPIKDACMLHFRDIGHNPDLLDVTYENVQARERTQILMDVANKEGALVVGTGDLSELALGWATYNGDHMSMYAVNSSVPKTLVRYLIGYFAEEMASGKTGETLRDILETPVSPELLPPDENGEIAQRTEELVGNYELHDFFLFHMMRNGFSPKKVYFLACIAFGGVFDKNEILRWLKVFYRRFFSQQFKRSCLPDGVKVGSVSLSPRGDWRMPSDASASLWLAELEGLEKEE